MGTEQATTVSKAPKAIKTSQPDVALVGLALDKGPAGTRLVGSPSKTHRFLMERVTDCKLQVEVTE